MRSTRSLAGLVLTLTVCLPLHAQDAPEAKTISVQLRDGRTGLPVKADNFLVRIDHHDTVLEGAVEIKDDGAVMVTVPAGATDISFKATYNASMDVYVNCDAAKQSDKQRNIWYPIATILQAGIVAPNECSKTNYKAKPGEFVFFVRKRDWREGD
jgi:hypothetical protein